VDDFVGAKFYYPHALADGNQHIWIREKTGALLNSIIYTVSVPPLRNFPDRYPKYNRFLGSEPN